MSSNCLESTAIKRIVPRGVIMELRILKQYIFLILVLFLYGIATVNGSAPCALRETPYGGVCVCNATYCDYLDDPTPEYDYEFVVVSSTKAGLRFDTTNGKFNLFKKYYIFDYDLRQQMQQFEKSVEPMPHIDASADFISNAATTRDVVLQVNRQQQHQKIVGFGGAFTGAVSHLMQQMSQQLQDHLYKSYYAPEGISYNLLRMSIGGCDFDLAPWAYNELPENDSQLSNFTLDARDALKITQIKQLKKVSNISKLKIKGAAWSSPRWMKSNNKWTGFSHLKTEYYQTWADYHLQWLKLMDEHDLPVWAISTGNEPLNGVLNMYFVRFMSLGWTPQNQAVWLSDHLGPTIRNSKFKDLILFGNDDQRYTFPKWYNMMKSVRPDAMDYINGFAVHWYWDEIFKPFFIDETLKEYPDKILLNTESCIGDKPWQVSRPLLGSWTRGEKYMRAFLQDFQHGFNGWIDWNLILDEQGGPNYVDNTVDAPLLANTTTFKEFYKQPMFYAMGHFSKFVPEGSVRIETEISNRNIDSVAFLRPDGAICVVLFNSGNANVDVNLADSVRGTVVFNIPPKSMHTVIYK